MQLSNEDNLRLNVLLAQAPHAIRINEATMTLYALTAKGEAKIKLNPTVRDEQYLRWIRELLSLKVTDSPGGYPVFLKRWTRMGHTRNNLEQMLLLGEPEAVAAVVHAPSLSHEVGRRAWWASPTAENARRLLEKPEVVAGELGKTLAAYLLEFLPFEELALDVVDSVRLCLQANLISAEERYKLWNRAKRKNPFYVGFLHADAALIPLALKSHKELSNLSQLTSPDFTHNKFAKAFLKTLNAEGQNWLRTLQFALEKPVDQDVVISLFMAIQHFFDLSFAESRGVRNLTTALQRAEAYANGQGCELNNALVATLTPAQVILYQAMLVLAQLGEDSLIAYFGGSDAVGSVMRNQLKPLVQPILQQTQCLLA